MARSGDYLSVLSFGGGSLDAFSNPGHLDLNGSKFVQSGEPGVTARTITGHADAPGNQRETGQVGQILGSGASGRVGLAAGFASSISQAA